MAKEIVAKQHKLQKSEVEVKQTLETGFRHKNG